MLLTISYTRPPASDLGFLLHKNPGRVHTLELSFGHAHVFFPEVSETFCKAALLLDVDPVGLVRGKMAGGGGTLDQYVNDRPYVASSFMSVAMSRMFSTAMSGRSRERQDLAETPHALEAEVSVVACRDGEGFLRRLFEPLGYEVQLEGFLLDPVFPEWGPSPYFSLKLRGRVRLQSLLAHLYVLIPVLDDYKHYWVDEEEIDKLLRRGEGWLESHPEREAIVHRYLRRQKRLTRVALSRLAEDQVDPDREEMARDSEEQAVESALGLNEQRLQAVAASLKESGGKRVIDLGCGEGKLLERLTSDASFANLAGMDVSVRALEAAHRRLGLDEYPARRDRIELFHGALTYRDQRLSGYDAAALVEVIEHLDPPRLAAFERVVFEFARPGTIVVTTPNAEYNVRFASLPAGRFRHKDHRFEWTRAQFEAWARSVAQRNGYRVHFASVGPVDPEVGAPSQMGVFSR